MSKIRRRERRKLERAERRRAYHRWSDRDGGRIEMVSPTDTVRYFEPAPWRVLFSASVYWCSVCWWFIRLTFRR